MKTVSLSLFALSLLSSFGLSQHPLIGFTAKSTPVESSTITRQVICDPPTKVCGDPLPWPTVPYAGGAAYSPMRESVWHSEGLRLMELPIDSCRPNCTMPATRALGTESRVGGLEISAARNEMFQVESIPGFAAVVTYDMKGKCPVSIGACRVQLPSAKHFSGGIAYDGKRDLIYVAISLFDGPVPDNHLLVMRRDGQCAPFCNLQVGACLTGRLGPIRALAYDECADQIYISDGRQTSVQNVIFTASSRCPVLRPVNCCPLNHPGGEVWCGFDLEPFRARKLGAGCTARPCANCPNVSLSAIGDAVVGNASFGFQIENAPAGSFGLVFLSPGPCTSGITLGCGQFMPALPPVLLPPFGLAGAPPCGGQGSVGLPIPNNYALCHAMLCAQGVILCPGSPVGLGLTNALVVVIDG